ncbi:hypothetical protein M5K25_015743 [Dendrobium thyrsiflorum]|uniref:Uncharacterized protein n=1 Tax=Dendrobium thyrsiflorum TaxID=117978 RepID=A0ABD0URM0_DENTH
MPEIMKLCNWIILFKFSIEDPPSSIAFLAFSPNAFALFLLSSPFSPPVITFSTTFLTSSPFTNASSLILSTKKIGTFAPTATPILKTSTTNLSFTNWSANLGHVAITTPAAIASIVEFHPQCVINPPTATWSRIITCGAHPLITIPLPFVLSSNSDNQFSTSSLLSASFTTQRNDNCEDDAYSSPCPICTSWEMELHDKLPKLTNKTELGALESSQLNNNPVSMEEAFPLMALLSKSLLASDTGPMGHTYWNEKWTHLVLLQKMGAEYIETGWPIEGYVRYAEALSHRTNPEVHVIEDNAVSRHRRWVSSSEVKLDLLSEKGEGFHEGFEEIRGGDEVDVFAAGGEAGVGGGEGELDEADGVMGVLDAVNNGANAGGVNWGGDESDDGAGGGEEAGHVDHGDHVALSHERD